METPQEFSARAASLLAQAQRLSDATPDSDLSEWLDLAKRSGMTWVEGLELAIQRMLE